jgi:hypothetical protein
MVRLAVMLLAAVAAGCAATTRAQAPVERPTLETPPPPPRVIEPAPLPEVSQSEPVFTDLPPPPPDPTLGKKSPRDRASARDGKPEPKPDAQPAPTEPVATSPPPAQGTAPAPVLRTPASVDTAAIEKQIRDAINRANAGLQAVDFQRLSESRKGFYNEAKDLIAQAEAAIKNSNLELAKGLASQAEKLALTLQNR